ncbi:GNAT family N-acetyltransferase [Kitasatospora sp. NPDC088391]|uniref:GNAT family N-acetyltransferase n=1 Tax=Kitasatospora sp. NPDC088391 TaxID=3364074 RepID=UPI00382DC671
MADVRPVLVLRPEPVGSPDARWLLTEYRAEIHRRWSGPAPADPLPAEAPADLELGPPEGVFLLARLDGRPVGCAGVRVLEPGTAELKRLYVREEARGHGLGRRLLAAAEDAARGLGHTRLRLDTMAEMPEARALYTAAGYLDVPAYNTNPYAADWLEKAL